MDITTGKFKLKAAPNDAKLKCVQEKKILLQQMSGLSLYDRLRMFPDFSWRKHMNNNTTCGGVPKNLRRSVETILE